MKSETQHLPQDLIAGILLKLPVKSLVRFKGVCKFWRSLISDPHFARSHFELATPRLVFYANLGVQTMGIEGSLRSNPFSKAINIDILSACSPFRILGSCRGFLLLESNESLYLWNPSTRVHKPIPSSLVYNNVYPLLYGFGYDSSKDDYLVVQVFAQPRHSPGNLACVQIFSSTANMWKYTEGTYFPILNLPSEPIPGLLFNESIHWLDPDISDVIIAFDLMERRLLEIPLPDGLSHDLSSCDLWVYGRFLSLSVGSECDTVEIWVMEKYKVQSSWTKTLVLSMSGTPYLSPLCSTKSGDIIMDSATGLVKYTNKGALIEHRRHHSSPEYSVPVYTVSIFSLPAPGVSEQS